MNKAKKHKSANIESFFKLDKEKQNRIINSAMKEFGYGFKKSSTDIIAKEADISKGSLYYYFGTKEQLFMHVIKESIKIKKEAYDKTLALNNLDFIETFRQLNLLKKDILLKYPYLDRLAAGIWVHYEDTPKEAVELIQQQSDITYNKILKESNTSKFRPDINKEVACEIIAWATDVLVTDKLIETTEETMDKNEISKNFDNILDEYVKTLKLAFYI